MGRLSRQPLSESQHRLRGRKIAEMDNAQLRNWIDACQKMEQWSGVGAKARRGWKESGIAAQAELERREGGGVNVIGSE